MLPEIRKQPLVQSQGLEEAHDPYGDEEDREENRCEEPGTKDEGARSAFNFRKVVSPIHYMAYILLKGVRRPGFQDGLKGASVLSVHPFLESHSFFGCSFVFEGDHSLQSSYLFSRETPYRTTLIL